MTSALKGWGGYELSSQMSLTLRDREILIARTCALCRCEYEWGVHVAFFADKAELGRDQVRSLTHGSPEDPCWSSPRDGALIAAADSLHETSQLDDDLYTQLELALSHAELLDLMMAGIPSPVDN
ncbi:MAG: carboxymuconolactone decarboxylase family protein [Actinomycetia bacterium]|nr:carboxymuconolactone decarboxylase family protein [Actinomycetes bacterium]